MYKKKSLLIFILSALTVLIVSVLACNLSNPKRVSSESNKDKDVTVTLVLDLGGANDQSFNESALAGAERAALENNINLQFLESKQEADYASNIETAIDLESDLIIGVGFNLTNAIKDAAANYPDQKFAIIDGSFDEDIPLNVKPLLFNEADAGYLAGLITAKEVNSDNFGFVGGFEVPAVINFKDGFEKGLKEVNPNANLYIQYANSFSDAAKGKAIAKTMHNSGVSAIMTAAGGVNQGVYEASIESNNYAIGVDMAQGYIAPKTILTSALKNVDVAVEDTINEFINGNFTGGTASIYDLSNNGVGYEQTNLISKETEKYLEEKIKELK